MKGLASKVPFEYTLTIINGVEKGTVYKLMAREITIGRGSENNISIPYDLRCSRVHARIVFTSKGVKIMNMSDKNYIKIKGANKKSVYLKNDTEFTLGQTKFYFSFKSNISGMSTSKGLDKSFQVSGSASGAENPQNVVTGHFNGHDNQKFSGHSNKKKSSGRFKFYAFLGFIALLLLVLASTDDAKKKKKETELATQKNVNALIKKNTEIEQALKKRKGKLRSRTYKLSQEHYLKGFRDYRLGLYDRALDSFQACLSVFLDHPLCNRYLKLSQRKQAELVQFHMTLGRKYLAQGQYKSCRNAFSNAQFILKDKDNPLYKEAASNLKICNTRLEAIY